MSRGTQHLQRIEWAPNPRRPPDTSRWPFTIPAVAQIIEEGGLDIPPGVTFLVGENGSGKSTLVEALAAKYSRKGFENPYVAVTGPAADETPLQFHLKVLTHKHASPAGFFLRAEAMHEFLSSVDDDASQRFAWGGEKMQARSHGESFLAVLKHRFTDVGVYFLDEPEAALSFQSCLGLVALLDTMRREGSQVIVATHSPLLVSLPEATLLELSEDGIHEARAYEELALVQNWRQFLNAPARYLRHLLAAEGNDG
jgi:predicted ATPase